MGLEAVTTSIVLLSAPTHRAGIPYSEETNVKRQTYKKPFYNSLTSQRFSSPTS